MATYEPIANLKGPRGFGVGEPRLEGDDLVFPLLDGTEFVREVVVGNVRGLAGPRGVQGVAGPVGPAPSITLRVSTLAAGSETTVTKSGTDADPVYDLGIPRGATGATGATGARGPIPVVQATATTGEPGSSVQVTPTSTSDGVSFAFRVPRGDVGPAPVLSAGQVTTLPHGQQATSALVQTQPGSYVLNLGIPMGPAGAASQSIVDGPPSTETAWSSEKTHGEILLIIDDSATSAGKTWTSAKIASEIGLRANAALDERLVTEPSEDGLYSSQRVEERIDAELDAYVPQWSEVGGKPTAFPPATHSHGWSQIDGKPSTFAPAPHTHPSTDVPDLDSRMEKLKRGAPVRGGLLAGLRAGILNPSLRCVVAVVGDSIARAGTAPWIGFTERLAWRSGSQSFPLLDSLASRPGNAMQWLQGAEGGTSLSNYIPEARYVKLALAAPNYVIHVIGFGDYLFQNSKEHVQGHMRDKFARIEADTPGVVNVMVQAHTRPQDTVLPITWATYGQWMREVVNEKPGSRLFVSVADALDLYETGLRDNRSGLTGPDGTHPTHAGYRLLANIVGDALGIPTDEPSGEERYQVPFPASASYSANATLAAQAIGARSYPRWIEVTAATMYNATNVGTSTRWAEMQIVMTGHGANESYQQRLVGGADMSADLNRWFYLPPGVPTEVTARVRVNGGASVSLQGGTVYSLLQVVERPC